MMHHLLRGRFLYVVLGVLAVALYASTHWLGRPLETPMGPDLAHAPTAPRTEQTSSALTWWPEELDRTALQQLAAQRPRLALLLSCVTIGGMGLVLAGIVLLLWALGTGRVDAVWRFTSYPLPRWTFGEVGRIIFLTLIMASVLPLAQFATLFHRGDWMIDHNLRLAWMMVALDLFTILVMLVFAAGKGHSVGRALGLSPHRLATSIRVGLQGYVAVFPWLIALLVMAVEVTRRLGLPLPMEPIQELLFKEDRPLVLGLTVLLACLIGPVAEELFFRGILYPAIRSRASWGRAMFISAAFFALLHANPVGFPAILLLGCFLANLYERTGSLAGPLTVHILHNTLLISTAFLVRRLTTLAPPT